MTSGRAVMALDTNVLAPWLIAYLFVAVGRSSDRTADAVELHSRFRYPAPSPCRVADSATSGVGP